MFAKFLNLFKVKEDETLNYMNSEKLFNPKKETFRDPLNQDDEDEFFRELDEEKILLESLKIAEETPKTSQKDTPSRESILRKMHHCMQEKDWNPKHHPKLLIAITVVFLASTIAIIALHETPNPLIGKWKPLGKNIFLPTGDIEFSKDKVQAMGNSTPVKYDIEEHFIDVIDLTTNRHLTFYIKDDKNIECNILGVKTSYKKADK